MYIYSHKKEIIMSMRGEKISEEYQRMVFIRDKDGKEYACYIEDLKNLKKKEDLTPEEREKCMDISLVLGDSW
tara:strand:- start:90 stop:308 length:219 start_codon:yes stop_codon:yes gene_type:complete